MPDNWTQDTITLRGEEVELKIGYIDQVNLQYFPENPRIYSIVAAGDTTPTQEEIQEALLKREHVRQLAQSIKANGGLTDPIFVREDNLVVLEGNSRLAAYRMLAEKDPIKWGRIKCKILPKNIDEDKIFSLLGEYHIVGKQDWAPFEQAGYLYRRHNNYGTRPDEMANNLGLTTHEVTRLIAVYSFMIKQADTDPNKWSYYYEYCKSRTIKSCRDQYSTFDQVVVSKIKSGEIKKASDIRDDLPKIIKAGKKVITRLLNDKSDFYECVEIAKTKGVDEQSLQQIKRFRGWICSEEVADDIISLQPDIKKKVYYELKKIRESIELIEKRKDQNN